MENWEIGLLIVAGYIAVTSLVRLMRQHRDRLVVELSEQAKQEQRRKRKEEQAAKQHDSQQRRRRDDKK